MRHAAKTYASTLAMLQLDTILRYSVKYGKPKQPKKGVKKQEIFGLAIFFFISPIYFCIFAADFGRKSSKRYACFCM